MVIKNMGSALRYCIPQSIGRKLGEFWELIKPLVDFKYEVRTDEYAHSNIANGILIVRLLNPD